jgi:5'-deoxynucleotidase YfbR-like HD superfamily hydrolase
LISPCPKVKAKENKMNKEALEKLSNRSPQSVIKNKELGYIVRYEINPTKSITFIKEKEEGICVVLSDSTSKTDSFAKLGNDELYTEFFDSVIKTYREKVIAQINELLK